ncbi:hypothetical protein ACB098_11G143900 [Castanea mollissima]
MLWRKETWELYGGRIRLQTLVKKKLKSCYNIFNVSKNQLHALTSPLSESDQTTSLQCTKELGSKMQLSDSIACTLCVTCSEMQEFHKQHTWVVYNDEPRDQCPV